MSDTVNFTFSDTIAGRVAGFDREARVFTLVTADGRPFEVSLDGGPGAELLHNLGSPTRTPPATSTRCWRRAATSWRTASSTRGPTGCGSRPSG